MTQVWLSAAGLCGATLIGTALGFSVKQLPHKWNDIIMGFCAGVMLSAAILGLILPAYEQAGTQQWWVIAIGVLIGAMFLNLLDLTTPHLHHITGLEPEQHAIPNSAAVIIGVLGIISAIGVSVGEYRCSLLLEIVETVRAFAAFSGTLQCRKQKCRQNSNYCDYDQQFNQREAVPLQSSILD